MKPRMMCLVMVVLLGIVFLSDGCGGGGGGGGGSSGSSGSSGIAAPSNLRATKSYTLGELWITLNWTDNSNNEASFLIDMRPEGGAWLGVSTPNVVFAGTTSWEDEGVVCYAYPNANKVYFRVMAADANFTMSNPSNEICVTIR